MKIALLIIDLQKAYRNKHNVDSMEKAVAYINGVLPLFRAKNLPIVWIQHIDEEDGSVPGSEGFEWIEGLDPLPNEYIVHKTYGNGFNKTNLDQILAKQQVDTLLLTGYCAENCVLSTYRGALDLDYTPMLLRNGVASGSYENLKAVENISDIITYSVIAKLLGEV